MISYGEKDDFAYFNVLEIVYKHNGIDHYAKYLDIEKDALMSKIFAKLEKIEGN